MKSSEEQETDVREFCCAATAPTRRSSGEKIEFDSQREERRKTQGNKGRRTTSADAAGRDKLCRGEQKWLGGKKGMTDEREEKCQKG